MFLDLDRHIIHQFSNAENEINDGRKQSRQLSFSETSVSLLLRAIPIKHGKHRLLDYIAPKVWDKRDKPVTLSIHGREVIVDPNDLVGWHFAMIGSFDPEVVEILEKACNPDLKELFWDIGANKGTCFCNLASKLPLLHVVAIEPQALLSAHNINNLESICPGRYEYVQAGLGEEEAELTLIIPKSNLGRASLHIQDSSPDNDREVIKIKTASQIVESTQFGWPTVAKIDVEGHEPQVFRSLAPCFTSRTCKVLVFENHKSEAKAFETAKSVTEPNGYEIYGIKKSPWSTTLVPTKGQLSQITDYAVIRSDLAIENKQLAKLIAR
jgi:FkbM family methyltransferase